MKNTNIENIKIDKNAVWILFLSLLVFSILVFGATPNTSINKPQFQNVSTPTKIDITSVSIHEKSCKFSLRENPGDSITDLMKILRINLSEANIIEYSNKLKDFIYPKYKNGVCDIQLFLKDLNNTLELNLSSSKISEINSEIEKQLNQKRYDLPPRELELSNLYTSDISKQKIVIPDDDTAPYLIGNTFVLMVYVDSPSYKWTLLDIYTSLNEVKKMSDWLKGRSPESANVNFTLGLNSTLWYYRTNISVDSKPYSKASGNDGCGNWTYEGWMEEATRNLGFSDLDKDGYYGDDMVKYIKNISNSNNSVILFSLHTGERSYACGLGGIPRASVYFYDACILLCWTARYDTYAHETLHLFGAYDEYYKASDNTGCTGKYGDDCTTYFPYWNYTNGNCERCNNASIDSVMKNSQVIYSKPDAMTNYTKGQIGWGDHDSDSILDPLDECMYTFGYSEKNGCPYPKNYTCSNCTDCNEKILSAQLGSIVQLTTDIRNITGSCINIEKNNLTFDCQYHSIDAINGIFGINLQGRNGNLIKNCVISNFTIAIDVYNSSNNIITNNVIKSNKWGVYISDSSNNEIYNNIR